MSNMRDLEEVIMADFVKEATVVLRKYSTDIDWNKPANTWGGCFTCLPDSITFTDVERILYI